MIHFLLYTNPGSLVMVVAASIVVAVVVWWAVTLAVAGLVVAVLRLRDLYRPAGKS